jgi:hypothetical protein
MTSRFLLRRGSLAISIHHRIHNSTQFSSSLSIILRFGLLPKKQTGRGKCVFRVRVSVCGSRIFHAFLDVFIELWTWFGGRVEIRVWFDRQGIVWCIRWVREVTVNHTNGSNTQVGQTFWSPPTHDPTISRLKATNIE